MDLHNQDQLFAAVVDVAATSRKMYEELIRRKFTPDQALELTKVFIGNLIGGSK